MSDQAKQALQAHFGFKQFKEGQETVIDHLLAGCSAAAVFPTGGGKSICYQLPALLLDGLTLVVSPLIALMKDQIDALAARGINAQRLDSTLDAQEYRKVMDDIRDGSLRLLYVAPERFNNERFRNAIANIKIALFAVDEAHCISEWGHNFRPDYLKLVGFAKTCKAERVLALTATATREVRADICRAFDIAPECAVNTGFYRANLTLLTHAVPASERDRLLLSTITEQPPGPSIIYVTLQKTAESVAKYLRDNGIDAKHYHAGMKDDLRADVQDWFIASGQGIVVATIAFGMGIDKADIRYVFHYNLPKSLENYAQEIGRAGRDGNSSTCHLLAVAEDLIPLENFVYGDTPTPEAIQDFVSYIFARDVDFDISLYELSRQCDIRPLVLRTLLTQLELQGYLTGGTPFYASYQFKPLYSSKEILGRFVGERRQFLSDIFRQATKARTWFDIDMDAAVTNLGATRQRLISALDYLADQQLLEVKVAGVRLRYVRKTHPDSVASLATELTQAAQQRENREIARLQQVVEWIVLDACQSSALSERFDRPLDTPCGHCSWCKNGEAVCLPDCKSTDLDASSVDQAVALQAEYADVLRSPTELARVLCGLSSPKISQLRLQKTAMFGIAERVPYAQVLEHMCMVFQEFVGS